MIEPFGDVPRLAFEAAERADVAIQSVTEHEGGTMVCFRADAPVPMYCCVVIEPGLTTAVMLDMLVDAATRARESVQPASPLPTARVHK